MSKLDYNEDDIQTVIDLTGKTPEKAEKYILDTYKDLEDDTADIFDVLDVIEWEVKRKQENKREYVSSGKREKPSKPKTVKVSDEKKQLFDEIWTNIYDVFRENAQIIKENKEIRVKINEKEFKLDIIEKRPPKNK